MTARHPRYPDTPKERRALLRARRSTKALGTLDLLAVLVPEDTELPVGWHWGGQAERGRHLRRLLHLENNPDFSRDWHGRFQRKVPRQMSRLLLDRQRET